MEQISGCLPVGSRLQPYDYEAYMSDQLALDLYQQDVSSFYTDEICPEAETVYRFLLSIGFKEAKAQQYLLKVFGKIAGDVSPFQKGSADAVRTQVLAFVWEDISHSGFKQSQSPATIEKQLAPLGVAERAVLVLTDGLGFSLAAVEEILNAPKDQVTAALVAGRRAITPASSHPSGEPETIGLLFARLSDYLDGDMAEKHSQTYEPLLQAEAPELAKQFAHAKGQLQLALQKFYLGEDTRNLIIGSGISDKKRRQFEAQQIDEASSLESKGRWLRGLILVGLSLVFAFGAYSILGPKPKSSFDPLTALSYEAVMMEEEGTGRVEFLTSSIEDVNDFFADTNSIGFSVPEVKALPSPWTLDGATIIDYETDKIATVQYGHPSLGKMFIFYYKGSIQDLPTSSGAHHKDVYYQSYGNDQMNVVAHQATDEIVGMAVGRESAAKLAQLTIVPPAKP